MALPANLTTCRLEGTFIDLEGDAQVGHVIVSPNATLVSVSENRIIMSGPITIPLDVNGYFSVVLPVTNDADLLPLNFTYRIREMIPGGRQPYDILLPAGNETVDLASYDPAPIVPVPLDTELEARVQALENRPRLTVGTLYPSSPRVGDVHFIPNW